MADGFIGDFDTVSLCRYIGQTVTIFTASGGLSGHGFTGILIAANDCFVKLISRIGAAPDCPVGSTCGVPPRAGYGYGGCGLGYDAVGAGLAYGGLGSVVVIPTDKIVSFVHNAI
ncbi:MAG: hypothetical protein CVU84_00545 [Firmicutes bacterium HGW-Firmicutes-1]|jgi:hypothetical protein|nr:MAG: hypothetical protein CVU84_00545 [Firmicutes bacterium HGW-Firmicutes-1]